MGKIIRLIYHLLSKLLAKQHLHVVKALPYLSRNPRISLNRLDYVRISCLELAAAEIYEQDLPGSVAELGVYQGDFAKDLNFIFPGKILYLFDTFTGFDARDVVTEVTKGFSNGNQDFSQTSVDLVLSKMPYPNKCVIKKGYFPETAISVNESFCLVSIDTDLYKPTLAGLKFFYPRLCKGGYLFIHDYNNNEYPGVAQAVKEFCRLAGCSFVPIGDIGGTAIISK